MTKEQTIQALMAKADQLVFVTGDEDIEVFNAARASLESALREALAPAVETLPVPASMTLADRCKTALACMPESQFRAQTERLFAELLAAIPADGDVKETT